MNLTLVEVLLNMFTSFTDEKHEADDDRLSSSTHPVCARGASIHGDVLNVHTVTFSVTLHHTTPTTLNHNKTRRQRKKTEKEREEKEDRDREKRRRKRRRQDKTKREERTEKGQETRRKR